MPRLTFRSSVSSGTNQRVSSTSSRVVAPNNSSFRTHWLTKASPPHSHSHNRRTLDSNSEGRSNLYLRRYKLVIPTMGSHQSTKTRPTLRKLSTHGPSPTNFKDLSNSRVTLYIRCLSRHRKVSNNSSFNSSSKGGMQQSFKVTSQVNYL